jgi:hypothetical protein
MRTQRLLTSMECLGRIHEWVRQKTGKAAECSLKKIDETLKLAEAEIGHLRGLAAVEYDDDEAHGAVYVFEDLPKRVKQMRTRYGNLKLCSGWYVSSGLGVWRVGAYMPKAGKQAHEAEVFRAFIEAERLSEPQSYLASAVCHLSAEEVSQGARHHQGADSPAILGLRP